VSKRRAEGPAVTKRPGRRPKSPWRWLRRLLILGLVLGLMGVLTFAVLYRAISIPSPNRDFAAQTTKVLYADGTQEIGSFATQNRESIPLEEMPDCIKDGVVAGEDRTFWTNRGIDPKGIIRAAFSNARGNSTQGASTITQQYVKILYLTQERTLTRKIKEAIISLKLHRQQSKEEILAGYLNTIYYGRGAYGIQAAAEAFFDVPAKDLNLRQCAVLSSVINNPNNLDPANGKDDKRRLRERYRYVLSGMATMGAVTPAQADKAKKKLPAFPEIQGESRYGGQRGHMLRLVRDQMLRLGYTDQDIDSGGYRVTTTLTPAAMSAAEQAVIEVRPEGFDKGALHVATASVDVKTGALLGFYGGQDYLDSQINWAVAGGMIGSTAKPFTVATALEEGFALKDTFEGNSPFEFPDGLEVKNEGSGTGTDYGSAVSMTYALQESINTAFVDMTDSMDDGPAKTYDTMLRLGIPPDKASKKYPGIPSTSRDLSPDDTLVTLGRARISPINMANSYATLANEGRRHDVYVISKIVDKAGETVYAHKTASTKAIDPDIAADTTYAMQKVVTEGTGTAARPLGRPAGGKTGTATNDKDQVSSAWFVGMTPQIATAVMYVRGDGDDQLDAWLPSYYGGSYPAQTWTALMQTMMDGLPVEEFPEPAFVDGDAPSSGHEQTYAPPTQSQRPRPTRRTNKPRPTKSLGVPTTRPTEAPTTEAPPTTQAPTTEPTIAPPTLPTEVPTVLPTAPPTPVPTDSASAAAWVNGRTR
jgi:membrane peptidoglycan carboxypeptidase